MDKDLENRPMLEAEAIRNVVLEELAARHDHGR
jgi:hypothetical protein